MKEINVEKMKALISNRSDILQERQEITCQLNKKIYACEDEFIRLTKNFVDWGEAYRLQSIMIACFRPWALGGFDEHFATTEFVEAQEKIKIIQKKLRKIGFESIGINMLCQAALVDQKSYMIDVVGSHKKLIDLIAYDKDKFNGLNDRIF